jgi:hypothetical protein
VNLVATIGGTAFETAGAGRVAVELDDPVRRKTGALVQVVDVLGDAAVEPVEAMSSASARCAVFGRAARITG